MRTTCGRSSDCSLPSSSSPSSASTVSSVLLSVTQALFAAASGTAMVYFIVMCCCCCCCCDHHSFADCILLSFLFLSDVRRSDHLQYPLARSRPHLFFVFFLRSIDRRLPWCLSSTTSPATTTATSAAIEIQSSQTGWRLRSALVFRVHRRGLRSGME